jgi:hypothetical protein
MSASLMRHVLAILACLEKAMFPNKQCTARPCSKTPSRRHATSRDPARKSKGPYPTILLGQVTRQHMVCTIELAPRHDPTRRLPSRSHATHLVSTLRARRRALRRDPHRTNGRLHARFGRFPSYALTEHLDPPYEASWKKGSVRHIPAQSGIQAQN